MVLVYATPEQLGAWTGQAVPANAATLLRSASLLVQAASRSAVYATDTTGAPTATVVRDALRDATTAQAATWATLGIDPVAGAAGAAASTVTSSSIGGASISLADPGATLAAKSTAATGLCLEASVILRQAGLLSAAVAAY